MEQIVNIIEMFFEQVMGSKEYHRMVTAQYAYVKLKAFDNGKVSGLGLWGSEPKAFTIDFGKTFNQLEFECECKCFSHAVKDQDTAPCPHVLRMLIELESKITNQPFDTIYYNRINSIIPF